MYPYFRSALNEGFHCIQYSMCLTCKWWFPIGQSQEWCFDGSADSAQDLLCLVDSLPVWPVSILAESHTFSLQLTTACTVFSYEASYLDHLQY